MRGQVLGVDRDTGEGQISGDDGQRYAFLPRDWSDRTGPAVGALIDFDVEGRNARRIYRKPGTLPVATATPPPAGGRNKYIAAVLASSSASSASTASISGAPEPAFSCWCSALPLVGLVVTGLWALIDTIRYLVMPDDEFAARYNRRPA